MREWFFLAERAVVPLPRFPARMITGQAASRAVQNAQLCAIAKVFSVCGTGGTSDCICWVSPLNNGQNGAPNEDGSPRLAKFVQYPFMAVASCCCGADSALPKAAVGSPNRYWISDACAAP